MKSEKVRGYIKPIESFRTLGEWEEMSTYLLDLQEKGMDSRGGELSCKNMRFCNTADFERFVGLISEYFGHLLGVEVDRWKLLTRKNVLDFIEDFVNHRLWALEKEFGHYFPNFRNLKISYFYSRGDIEPYVLLDDEYTKQLYGGTFNPLVVKHYASLDGVKRLKSAIETKRTFDISTFTNSERPFFRPESNLIVSLLGNVRAGFRSDIKSYAVSNGRRACNMYRLGHPGTDNNICYDLDRCSGDIKTNLWNEIIVSPLKILKIEEL
jgi:hypothetical protein